MGKLSHHIRNLIDRLVRDRRANAAIEFALVVPLMLVMFFGMVEFSSGIAASRKVTLVARTMSDLVSQSSSVTVSDITNFNTTGTAIMNPYPLTTLTTRVSQIYVDPDTLVGKVIWSKGTGVADRLANSAINVPTAMQIGGTYLIYSEVSYTYVPAVGYVMAKAGVSLTDQMYTRPRISLCVLYSGATSCGT
jgi:Flp pilus assembly protein TadG